MNDKYLEYKELLEKHLLDFLPDIDHKSITLYESMKYSLTAGGKRLRPVLLLASCDFAGGSVTDALPYACAMEYIQTYSLIHDDLPAMDNDDLRRGVPTNHKVFGDAIAILAGDGLLNTAFECMNKDMLMYFDEPEKLKNRVKASYEIAKGAGCRGMVAGQVADIEAEGKQCSKEMLEYMFINKTSALIVASVRAGLMLGGADDRMLDDLTKYAECIGLAFQIEDDLLDVLGDAKELGKKTGMDAERAKSTYPALYGIEKSHERLSELYEAAANYIAPYYDNAEFFAAIIEMLKNRRK
ncbi:MAG: polyprenyl synthetase family protein [Firmicutes bacterium]|jgi:geranylgeranyl diphosphate synthase type II|nr:polyprenyl synthetase family protein [Bacillota bacterium]